MKQTAAAAATTTAILNTQNNETISENKADWIDREEVEFKAMCNNDDTNKMYYFW